MEDREWIRLGNDVNCLEFAPDIQYTLAGESGAENIFKASLKIFAGAHNKGAGCVFMNGCERQKDSRTIHRIVLDCQRNVARFGGRITAGHACSIIIKRRDIMKPIINPLVHGYLDYFTVAVFLLAPSLLGLSGPAGTLAYALAVIHLVMTLVTDFPLSIRKLVPFRIHGWVERIVGPVLLLLPFVLGFAGIDRVFYFVMGVTIIVVGLLTDYEVSV
jgi:hypothetical protein